MPPILTMARFRGCRECGRMKGRGQWRAFAASGDIAAPKIGHCGNAGQLGDAIGVADLQGKS